jgi:hypothetical protein
MPVRIALPDEQRQVLEQALADAISYQDPPLYCLACDAQDALCEQCAAGLARARSYLTLGRAMGIGIEETH